MCFVIAIITAFYESFYIYYAVTAWNHLTADTVGPGDMGASIIWALTFALCFAYGIITPAVFIPTFFNRPPNRMLIVFGIIGLFACLPAGIRMFIWKSRLNRDNP